MKRKVCKTAAACFCMAGITFCQPLVSHGAWQLSGFKWQYKPEGSSEVLKSVWHKTDEEWYRFDGSGFMATGWYLDTDGRWYFLNPVSDGTKGKMMTGWQWIDGYCYYLSPQSSQLHPLGSMYVNEKTPDGYEVDQNGAWTDEKGMPVYAPGKGIATKTKETEIRKGTGSGGGSSGNARGNTGKEKSAGEENGGSEPQSGTETLHQNGISPDSSTPPATFSTEPETLSPESETLSPTPDTGDTREKVNWQVHFTDSSAHQLHLAPSRTGSIEDGDHLTIYFQTQITDAQGRIWKSLQQSPYIVTVTGPQNRLIYVEYIQTGETENEPAQAEQEILKTYMELARDTEAGFLGVKPEEVPDSRFLVSDKNACAHRLKSAASRLEPGQSGTFYVIGKNYVPEGTGIKELYGDEMEYSRETEQAVTVEGDTYMAIRFRISRNSPETEEEHIWTGNEKRHWNIGDVQERILDGIPYRFRCIDQNYGDETDRSRQKALFLCDTVIRADTGSEYIYEKTEGGTYEYRFYPGPIVSFGDTDSYKYSAVRKWLNMSLEEFGETFKVPTGVTYGYEGSTEPESGQALQSKDLKSHYIGSQNMEDGLFILSVDEALKYRQWLWKFYGSHEENPESQHHTFCKSYWLRTPEWNQGERNHVYVVDLVLKNIHPQAVTKEGSFEDQELESTTSTGVRPAFVVQQY